MMEDKETIVTPAQANEVVEKKNFDNEETEEKERATSVTTGKDTATEKQNQVPVKTNNKKKKDDILQPANKKGQHINPMLSFLRLWLLPLARLLFPFKIYGLKKVPDGPFIYVGNHYRIWDIAIPPCTTPEGIHFLAKSELKKSFIAPFCKAAKVIFLDRNGEDIRGVMDAIKCLRNGEKIAIYPEGTRNKTDEPMLPFQSGAAMLSIKTKTPIIPVVIYKKMMPFRINHVIVGEPFELSEYYGKKLTQELLAEADEKLRNHLLFLREEHTKLLETEKKK